MKNIPTWLPVVAVALRAADDRWLLHRRPAGKQHGGLWKFPGGKVEPDELPDFAIKREIQEELGIALDTAALEPSTFARTAPGGSDREIVILLYTCAAWLGEPTALEGGEVGWFTPTEALALPMPPLDIALRRHLFGEAAG